MGISQGAKEEAAKNDIKEGRKETTILSKGNQGSHNSCPNVINITARRKSYHRPV